MGAPAPLNLLQFSDDEIRARVEGISIRRHSTGMGTQPGMATGVEQASTEILTAIAEEVRPSLGEMVMQLRPRFDELAAPLITAAQHYGFTCAATSDDVIEMAGEGASAAWRATPRAWSAIAPSLHSESRCPPPSKSAPPSRTSAPTTSPPASSGTAQLLHLLRSRRELVLHHGPLHRRQDNRTPRLARPRIRRADLEHPHRGI